MIKLLFATLALSLFPLGFANAGEETPLAQKMGVMNDAFKALRRTEDMAEGAKLARKAQEALLATLAETPSLVNKGMHPSGKEKAMAAYRKQLAQVLVTFCELEEAFLAGDKDKVEALIDSVRYAKKTAHDEFTE